MNKRDSVMIWMCIVAMLVASVGIVYSINRELAAVQVQAGDLNRDGVVDALDLSRLLSDWQKDKSVADLNHDGIVYDSDATILMAHWTNPVDIQQATKSGGLK